MIAAEFDILRGRERNCAPVSPSFDAPISATPLPREDRS
jgi:hypothetical protein